MPCDLRQRVHEAAVHDGLHTAGSHGSRPSRQRRHALQLQARLHQPDGVGEQAHLQAAAAAPR